MPLTSGIKGQLPWCSHGCLNATMFRTIVIKPTAIQNGDKDSEEEPITICCMSHQFEWCDDCVDKLGNKRNEKVHRKYYKYGRKSRKTWRDCMENEIRIEKDYV